MNHPIFKSYEQSLTRLEEVLHETPNAINRDAAIQRFEFTTELAWKTVQRFLREQNLMCRSPRECLTQAFTFGLVADDVSWIKILEDRNLTSHTYDEQTAQNIYERLPSYLPAFKQLREKLNSAREKTS